MSDEFKTNCFQIITNLDESNILLKKTNSKFYLPKHKFSLADEMFTELKKETGLDTTFLYSVDFDLADDRKSQDIINLSIAQEMNANNDYYWIDINNLDDNFIDFNLIEKWLNQTRFKTFTVSWFNKNWFNDIKPYIKSKLEKNGYIVLKEIEQFYLSAISCILKVETDKGLVYIKRVLDPVFKHEPLITQKMSEYYPKYFPEIIFTDEEKGFIFTKDFGKNELSESKSIDEWINAAKSYAQLQISMVKHSSDLLSYGMFDRSINKITTQMKDILIKGDKIFLDEENCVTSQEVKHILDNFDKIENLVLELKNYNIPETIEHGDLHSGNIAVKDNNIIFYDWSDCAISHPFVSMRVFFWDFFERDGKLKDKSKDFNITQDPYELIVDAYLSEWSEYGNKEDLRKAFDLSKKVSYISFFIQYVALVYSMENHTKNIYKGHIYGGLKNIISFFKD